MRGNAMAVRPTVTDGEGLGKELVAASRVWWARW